MADLEMDAPKHVYLMLFMLTDRTNPRSKFKVAKGEDALTES